MLTLRNLALVLAPVPVVSGSLALSNWAHEDPNKCATRNEVQVESVHRSPAWRAPPARPWAADDLSRRCHILARRVVAQLNPGDAVIVRTPLVIGGNIPPKQLKRWHQDTIAPAMSAMRRDFFRVPPDYPITILLFSDEATYRKYAWRLFGATQLSIYGYYQPVSRTVVINLSAGGGTLVHELTHALIEFDFPDVPIWFNEGLASFHEHCKLETTDEGPVVRPLLNWRLGILQEAILESRLQPTWDFMREESFRGRDEAILYAHARYFCFFLHERGVLQDFHAALRDEHPRDRYGDNIARTFFPGQTWPQIEREFRLWVMKQPR